MKLTEIKNICYLAKGHRGVIHKGTYKGKKVIIKTKLIESLASGRIENEANFLKLLNKKSVGPSVLHYDKKKDLMVCSYAEGLFLPEYLDRCKGQDKAKIKAILKDVFMQCYEMDRLKINKEEMHHPYKHIIISPKTGKPTLVDFERCHYTLKPSNVTQFCSYVASGFISEILRKKGININRDKIINAAKTYKQKVTKNNLCKITGLLR